MEMNCQATAMRPIKHPLICLCCWACLLMLNSVQAQQLRPFKASYQAFRFDQNVGHAVLFLQQLDNDYYRLRYDSKLSRFFLSDNRFEESVFRREKDKLLPFQYRYQRTGTGPDKALAVDFDTTAATIKINNDTHLPWQGEMDNQLYRIDLPLKLAKGATHLSYSFVNYRGEIREYQFKVLGKEQLTLPYGMLEGIKVKIVRSSTKRQTYAWFSPELNYTLVRLQQFKEGKEQADIRLEKFEQLGLCPQSPHVSHPC